MEEHIRDWILNLSDDFIAQWANRGMLRRGRKLAGKSGPADVVAAPTAAGHLEGYQQTIEGAGFGFLACSCPVVGPCHHLVALLVLLQGVLAEAARPNREPARTDGSVRPAPWLITDPDDRRRQLGGSPLRRAWKLMMQAVPVDLDVDRAGLTAVIREAVEQTVRIPRHGGLAASLCSCHATRCAHRALAVLAACKAEGRLTPDETDTPSALSPLQEKAMEQIDDWLKHLLIQGSHHTPVSRIDSGRALATLARQADLPKIAARLRGICRWLADEKKGAAHVKPEELRLRLAGIAVRLTALRARPMPRPLLRLAGVHARRYRLIRDLTLIGVGAQLWENPDAYCGFTLYLYCPDLDKWFRHSQVRPARAAAETGWRADTEYHHGIWAMGPAYRDICGHKIHVHQGWVSPDERISARDGTRISETISMEDLTDLPVYDDFRTLAKALADNLSESLFSTESHLPAVIAFQGFDAPVFDPYRQVWSRKGFDSSGRAVRLRLDAALPSGSASRIPAPLTASGTQTIFGRVFQEAGELALHPISMLSGTDPVQWRHLTLEEKNGGEKR